MTEGCPGILCRLQPQFILNFAAKARSGEDRHDDIEVNFEYTSMLFLKINVLCRGYIDLDRREWCMTSFTLRGLGKGKRPDNIDLD